MLMILFGLLSWWYTIGWLTVMRKCGARVQAVLRFFSVPLLIGSLFAPFRQISAGRVQGPLGVQLKAWGDRLFSRIIGAVVRTMLILTGLIIVAVMIVIALVILAVWPLVPIAPVIGLLFIGSGD